jgi:hemerythrin-like domain-containing protein
MKPIGPLMWEHRLIEQIVPLMEKEVDRIERTNVPDVDFIDTAVDFFRVYADRTHHGKEEDILFRDLAAKELSPDLAKIMSELTNEHVRARDLVGRLRKSREEYGKGESAASETIKACLIELSNLYPKHIEKEDKHFFYPILDYLSKEEQAAMLDEFNELDRKMIHAKYRDVIERSGGKIIGQR